MKRGAGLIVLAAWLPLGLAAGEPPLPSWEAGFGAPSELPRFRAGEQLLAPDPEEDGAPEEGEVAVLELEPPQADDPAGEQGAPVEIEGKFLSAYFDARPESLLVDPQKLLPEEDFRDRLGFLEYHASDSTIDLLVYLFSADQEIPGEVRKEELMEWYYGSGQPAAVVFYYLGAPERSEVHLSASLTDVVSPAEQRRALQSSLAIAAEKRTPEEQLEAFLVQMSIRVYWMERMVERDSTERGDVAVAPRVRDERAEKPAGGRSAATFWVLALVSEWGAPLAGAFGAGAGLAGLAWWWRSRSRYRFPELEVEPRLGGSHAAGVGAVISFSSAALPPASQRDQVPDYLRRA